MKEIYSWIPWFAELSEKIAQIPEGEELSLADCAMNRIPWNKDGKIPAIKEDTPLLKYGRENVDPFSFVSYIASCAGKTKNPGGPTKETRRRVYGAIKEEFDLSGEIPLDVEDAWGFPIPNPNPPGSLFHDGGRGNPESLWHLFRAAVKVREIGDLDSFPVEYFEDALEIPQVKKKKLTRGLSLVNPYVFFPCNVLGEHVDKLPGKIPWTEYRDAIKEIYGKHVGQPYEISVAIYDAQLGDSGSDSRLDELKKKFSSGNWRETTLRELGIASREDKPRDFEELVYWTLRKVLPSTRSVGFQHSENHAIKGDNGKFLFRLRPDIVVDGKIIVDTKYKELEPASEDLGVEPSDIYQMLAYARAYEAERVVLIYPQAANDGKPGIQKTWGLLGADADKPIPLQVATVDMDDLDSMPETLREIFAE